MTRTKIVATIGPRTVNERSIVAMLDAGMDVARLNGSHSTPEWHTAAVDLLRRVAPDLPILLDIPGRKIRTARLAHEPTFVNGDTITLTTDLEHDGRSKVPVNYPRLHEDLSQGDIILADDGQLRFTVLDVRGADIVCRAEGGGTLRSAKGINVPNVELRTALVTERDQHLLAFARKSELEYVGISFVESAEHVRAVRELLGVDNVRIVAKVENRRAMGHLDEIVRVADAIMIDRGDLSVETALESVALSQKQILRAARVAACPVIVATEMLHSMIASPNPTKAEISDITNAVLDGASALMLSGETAIGEYPVEALGTMRRTADRAWDFLQAEAGAFAGGETTPEAMGDAIALICRRAPVTKIVAITISGFAARMVSAQRPRQPIIAVSNRAASARAFNLLAGVAGVFMDVPFVRDSTDHIAACLEGLWRRQLLCDDDITLVVSLAYPKSGNRMNLLQMHRVGDLRDSLGWDR